MFKKLHTLRILCAATPALFLISCGGSSSGTPTPTPPSTAAKAPTNFSAVPNCTSASSCSVTFTWTQSDYQSNQGYNIILDIQGSGDFINLDFPESGVSNSYTQSDVSAGVTYTVTYSAANMIGASATAQTSFTPTYTPPPPPGSLPTPSSYASIPFRGVNLSGFEFGSSLCPTCVPTVDDDASFAWAGMNTIRFPIRWEYFLQDQTSAASVDGPLNTANLDIAQTFVAQMLEAGYNVILDMHDYMHFSPAAGANTNTTPFYSAADLAHVWGTLTDPNTPGSFYQLAKTYPSAGHSNQLIFDLMNEPNNVPSTQTGVLDVENAAIAAIRANGVTNLVLLEGNSWSGLHSWVDGSQDGSGQTNAQVFTKAAIHDSANNYAINVHEYFDGDFSGTNPYCGSDQNTPDNKASALLTRINFDAFVAWMQKAQVPVFVTEFGSGAGTDCQNDVDWFLSALESNAYTTANGYGFKGWTAWSAGHAWWGGYILGLNPGDEAAPMLQSTYSKHLTSVSS